MADLERIRIDLAAELGHLDAIVDPLPPQHWESTTPAEGWTVRDQISHLTFFDAAATQAVKDPDGFSEALERAVNDIEGYMNRPLQEGRALSPHDVLSKWRRHRNEMLEAFSEVDPSVRIPWFGPPMSPASFMSARLMETWAHGQDIADALGIERFATDRLKHVAHLGVRARAFSYATNNRAAPTELVEVRLRAPSGDVWTWDEGAANSVTGDALDFCLVVTQRRHPDDTDLVAEGSLAKEWISIAQAFAGPPGAGRRPGQFPRFAG